MESERATQPPAPQRTAGSSAKKKLVEELHHAPGLVGRIVEKGFSPAREPQKKPSPASFPRPSVLPFPVARHRSHNPYRSPNAPETGNGQDGSEEDKDETDYEPISFFANPIERKEKKGLDLSRWREMVSAAPQAKKKEIKNTTLQEGAANTPTILNSDAHKESLPRSSGIKKATRAVEKPAASAVEDEVSETNGRELPFLTNGIDEENRARLEQMSPEEIAEVQVEIAEKMEPKMLTMLKKRGQAKSGSKKAEQEGSHALLESNGLGSLSPVDDIDAENLVRLNQMSPEDIAEAQAEIMEKIDPAKLEMLKKRGQDKLGNKRGVAPKRDKGRKDLGTDQPVEGGKRPKSEPSPSDMPLPGEANNSTLWKAWSDRVEKVRALRFSLKGDVLEFDSTQEQSDDNKPECRGYIVENVAERDLLRTEGDPAAVGYTIKEAAALIRSLVPGQRVLALQLLASVFNKALCNLQKKDVYFTGKTNPNDNLVDWQAVWAFALGPEPEVALSLRIALDDNHDIVVLACAKAIHSVLSCDINEHFFNIKEKLPTHDKGICTTPVFRSRPEIDGGFLHGGFWKYNTKPSNLLPCHDEDEDEDEDEESEGKHTIQDDVVVAGQDVAAGLVRMGILPRICYLLEMGPLPTLEECLVSILVALARHSPTSANAIMRCPRLIQTVTKIFTKQGALEIYPSQIKAVTLLKVLSQSKKQICSDFVKRGVFQGAMWHWYRNAFTLDQWIKSGREHCKLTSAMMVEQLRLWRVCIRYGYCIRYFSDFFPAMCLWLSPPTFEKLIENDVLCEFASITREAYLVLEVLAERLPSLHSIEQLNKHETNFFDDNLESWSWSHVIPMVDISINWLALENHPYVSLFIRGRKGVTDHVQYPSVSCVLWVISAVLHMLCSVFNRIAPCNVDGLHSSSQLPWLPQFVPKVGLEIVKNGFLSFLGLETKTEELPSECGSLVEGLCCLRDQNDCDASLSSISCLHGLVRLAFSLDNTIQRARNANSLQPLKEYKPKISDKILEEGIIKWAQNDLLRIVSVSTYSVSSKWHDVQSVEVFGRGGPAPGVGIGWGSSGGGFWSFNILLAQTNAQLIVDLLEIFQVVVEKDLAFINERKPIIEGSSGAMALTIHRINSVLGVCLIAGPGDRATLERALDILLQASVLKYFSSCIHYFFQCNKGFKSFEGQYKEEDYLLFSKILNSHFRDRWLSTKQKLPGEVGRDDHKHAISQKSDALETIHEDLEISETVARYPDCSSLLIEWAHQRLPLPVHWFLSAICSIRDKTSTIMHSSSDILDVAKSGLFFILGLEVMSSVLCADSQDSPISAVPLVWKWHALSMALHVCMDVLEEDKSRNVFETLQELYGQHLDKLRCRNINALLDKNEKKSVSEVTLLDAQESSCLNILDFQTQVHESYSTFIENFIEQFGAISYGDIIYGRQVSLYLHRSVEAVVRLATWNALSNAHVLELLPPLGKCIAEAEGYLEPIENNEGILEAYVKSWISGGLDRAAARGSVTFTLALHHISCFIFSTGAFDKSALRKKLAKSLLRSSSQKQHQEDMLLDLVRYKLPMPQEFRHTETVRRFNVLKQACDGNSSLLAILEKLKSSVERC